MVLEKAAQISGQEPVGPENNDARGLGRIQVRVGRA